MFRRFFQESKDSSVTSIGEPALQASTRSTTSFSSMVANGAVALIKTGPSDHNNHASSSSQQQLAQDASIQELATFDVCIEACDELASTSTPSGRVDPATGLVDCSVLVSPDGDLLIVPLSSQPSNSNNRNDDDSQTNDKKEETLTSQEKEQQQYQAIQSMLNKTATELGNEYHAAIFLGNDLHSYGDKTMNGFSAKGWSIPAASLAMRQSADLIGDMANFVEDLVLTKKSSAAQENQVINHLRPLVEGPENGGLRIEEYKKYVGETFPDFQVLPHRVGPISAPGGTIQEALCGLESYFSSMAESDSHRWKTVAQNNGVLQQLRDEKERTDKRIANREAALVETFRRTSEMEETLKQCKTEAVQKWDAVHAAEEKVTELMEQKMVERSRMRSEQRMQQIKNDEAKRVTERSHGNLGATSSEIWDIVSAVTASMEDGSFEPMDLPQAPVAPPRDSSAESDLAASDSKDEDESSASIPITSRFELEAECELPELRSAAMAADESVRDAANSLLNVLSSWDTTKRSARLAAESSLVSAGSAQAKCMKAIIAAERESVKERMELLDELDAMANQMDARCDLEHYISIDKKDPGGRSFLGDDDDGGIASALAVLNNHIDGNMGMAPARQSYQNVANAAETEEEDASITPEFLEGSVEKFFEDAPSLKTDAPSNEKTDKVRKEFDMNVRIICKEAKAKTSTGRSRRSTICYCMNAKRDEKREIHSSLQFDGLVKVFKTVLGSVETDTSGSALAKMMMTLSQCLFFKKESEEVYVKNSLVSHPLWKKEQFWDHALYQTVAESLTHSGVMSNFERPRSNIVTAQAKKKSEWTEAYKMKWHDLSELERAEAASQVHAVVSAQIGALAQFMIEFGCGLERACAFVRRMAVRNQLPLSQRAMLLQHLIASVKEK